MMLAMLLGLLTACEVCVAEGCNGDLEGCAALSATGCEADPRCTEILAKPLNELAGSDSDGVDYCLDDSAVFEYVGCRDADLGCTEEPTIATDGDGFGWYLDEDCLPSDWDQESWETLDAC